MKFYQTIFLIYLIGVEAKHKRHGAKINSKAGKAHQPEGFRSSTEDEQQAGRNLLSDVNHGNIPRGVSKYGHFGLSVESNSERGVESFDGELASGEQANFNGANPVDPFSAIFKVKRSSNDEVKPEGQVEIQSEARAGGAQFGVNGIPQQYSVGQPSADYGRAPSLVPSQGGTPSALSYGQQQPLISSQLGSSDPFYGQGSVQAQNSVFGLPASYYNMALDQGGQLGAQLGQSGVQGQYSIGKPVGYRGSIGIAQDPYGQSNVGAPILAFGQPSSYYGPGTGQIKQLGAQFGQSGFQGQYSVGQPAGNLGSIGIAQGPYGQGNNRAPTSAFGQPFPYYGAVAGQGGQLSAQFGQSGVQGQYIAQPTSYYGNAPGKNIQGQVGYQQGDIWSWVMSLLGTSGALGQTAGPVNPTQFQAGLNTLGINYQQYGLVPGAYGRVASSGFSVGDYQRPLIHPLSRYISSGFYYPPPQHLNSNPNVWDPAARYYFAIDGQELFREASRPRQSASTNLNGFQSPSNGFSSHSNAFPITHSRF